MAIFSEKLQNLPGGWGLRLSWASFITHQNFRHFLNKKTLTSDLSPTLAKLWLLALHHTRICAVGKKKIVTASPL